MKLEMLHSIMFRSLTADFTQTRQYTCKTRAEIYIRPLKYGTTVTELIFVKPIFGRQLFVKKTLIQNFTQTENVVWLLIQGFGRTDVAYTRGVFFFT
jgi:hypothetical protein